MGVTKDTNEARAAWFRGGQCLITVQLPIYTSMLDTDTDMSGNAGRGDEWYGHGN